MVVRDDQVELRVEAGFETLLVLNSPPGGIEAGASEFAQRQVCVLRPVLQNQQTQGPSTHGSINSNAGTGN